MVEKLPEGYYGVDVEKVRMAVKMILAYNEFYIDKHGLEHFLSFSEGQSPRATVLTCSDSRVQMQAINPVPENDMFVVRNIGNQFAMAEGSIEYGVRHLHTPVLIILGHVRCGAITAAHDGHPCESAAIQRELDELQVDREKGLLENVILNVRHQVATALEKFDEEVRAGTLLVIGAVYDFADDLKCGHGKVVVTELNNAHVYEK